VEALGHPQNFTDRGKGLWDVLREHYDADPGLERAHEPILLRQLAVRYPRLEDDYAQYLDDLDSDPPVENLVDLLVETRQKDLARDMAVALVEGSLETFEALLSEYRSTEDLVNVGSTSLGTELSDLLAVQESGNRIPLGPARLNAAIRGGALPGHNVLIFGRPEIGKSALALAVLKAAGAAGYRVGMWENEDPLSTTQIRAVQCITESTEEEVRVNAGRLRHTLGEHGYYDRMFFRESPDGTIAEIDAWVEKHSLDVVIINQMVNLRTSAENRVLELSTIARGMRGIAKRRNCVVVGVAQAGESAAGRSQLRLEDLEWSNTGVQATLDLMIGIGADERLEQNGERWISLCKNKLGGTHDNILLDFDKERSHIHG
jgi:replicative DNA helicase